MILTPRVTEAVIGRFGTSRGFTFDTESPSTLTGTLQSQEFHERCVLEACNVLDLKQPVDIDGAADFRCLRTALFGSS